MIHSPNYFADRDSRPSISSGLYVVFALLVMSAIVASCDTVTPFDLDACHESIEGRCWTFLGLEHQQVMALADTPWGIFAGARQGNLSTGTYQFDAARSRWVSRGLTHALPGSLLMVPGDTPRLLAGMQPFSKGYPDAAVYATEDGGRTWKPWDDGLAQHRENDIWAFSLAQDPGNPQRLFMGQSAAILRSDDGGRTWTFVHNEGSTALGVTALHVSPTRDGRIWAGSQGPFDHAVVYRSSDWGDTWEHSFDERYINVIYDLIADPENPDHLWAGESGGMRLSTDGGISWTESFTLPAPGQVRGFVHYDGMVLAGVAHRIVELDTVVHSFLGLYRLVDGESTWESVPVPEQATALLSITKDRTGALLIGTDAGVWRVSNDN